ncbi:MAG: ribonuclease HII [Candidatus Paceibacterota bacterium]
MITKGKKYIIGVDEVGRGPLAGPVAVSAVLLPVDFKIEKNNNTPLRDSKKHTELQREYWFNFIKESPEIVFSYSYVSPKVIDRINISKATNRAATLSVQKIIKKTGISPNNCYTLLDGGISLGRNSNVEFESIIKGDEKIQSIKLASIVAKVKRDRTMVRYHKLFSNYNFKKHKGYGTREHMENIEKYGPCPIHRLTFI